MAVIQRLGKADPSHKDLLEDTVRQLGIGYAPERILDLERDLELTSFPMTTSGKLHKASLSTIVKKHLDKLNHRNSDTESASGTSVETPQSDYNTPAEDVLVELWARATCRPARDLEINIPITEFADSLMVIRFSGLVKKVVGKNISTKDISEYETIKSQASLLDGRPRIQQFGNHKMKLRIGPPTLTDMVHTSGAERHLQRTKEAVELKLRRFVLSWQDVEDIMPVPDYPAAELSQLRLQSWVVRQAFTTTLASCKQLQIALQSALTNNPLFRCAVFRYDGEPYFAIMRPSARLFRKLIVTHREVETPYDVSQLFLYDEDMDYALESALMFRAVVVHVKSTGTAGLVINAAHSSLDASSIGIFVDDVSNALAGVPLTAHGSFKRFADMKYMYRSTELANIDAAFHIERMRGVGK